MRVAPLFPFVRGPEGLDPTIGYLHADQPGRPALVLDVMEPLRPLVDLGVLRFMSRHSFEPGDFTIQDTGGVCRLVPRLVACLVGSIQ